MTSSRSEQLLHEHTGINHKQVLWERNILSKERSALNGHKAGAKLSTHRILLVLKNHVRQESIPVSLNVAPFTFVSLR